MATGRRLTRAVPDDPCTNRVCDNAVPPLQPSPTDEPDPGPTTSLTEIASVGPAETASSPDTTDSSTTTSLADASTTDATSTIPSPTATTVTIPHPPPTNPQTLQVAGISVGGVIGGLLLLFVVFLLIRRRKLAKRMPSFVDARGDQFDEKLMHDNQKAAVGGRSESHGDDVFAPFGGRATSPVKVNGRESTEPPKRLGTPHDSMLSIGGHSSIVSPITPASTGPSNWKDFPGGRTNDTIEEEKPGVPAQLDSSPVYIELDSRETERPGLTELPTVSVSSSIPRPKSANDVLKHPGLLTPGYRSVTEPVTQSESGQHGRPRSDSGNPLRGTLNATSAERQSNRHVNSWTHL
ncbi:uncharacterized protein PG998_002008 [Apiospora kogelbergensis]|uniref:uncharacterized protein n=1 Tax=Apiospora kogelbergensis TaxID=1337665 RepID=UPI00313167C9